MECQTNAYKVVSIISLLFLIISLCFIITQSIINIVYSLNINNKIIAERLIYEQFSHEVYSNINSHPIIKINFGTCPSDYEQIRIPIKIDKFYDCGKDENSDIDEFCQNKITPESLCCLKSCCFEKIENKKESKYCLQKRELNENDIRKNNEPREAACSKFSNYLGKFYNLNKEKICVQKSGKTYEDYLKENEYHKYSTNYKLDSKGHYFYGTENLDYYYPGILIVKNIFSTTQPNYFEMESKLRISMMLNKKEYNENKIKKEIKKISEISSKNIYDTFSASECSKEECNNPNYILFNNYYNLKEVVLDSNDEYIFNNYKNDIYYSEKPIYWYIRNYIGFENTTELNKFKEFFDANDHKNNCLFRISKTLYPNFESIVIGIIFIGLSIFFIIQLITNFKNNNINIDLFNIDLDLIILLVVIILFLIYFLIYLIGYLIKFKEIDIDMEDFYRNILRKYNYRRRQLFLMIAVIILILDIFLELLIQNIKYSIKNPERIGINFIQVTIKINESPCQNQHNIRLYITKKFKDHIQKINKIFANCKNCRNFDVNEYKVNGIEIDENRTIQENNIPDGNIIICEE